MINHLAVVNHVSMDIFTGFTIIEIISLIIALAALGSLSGFSAGIFGVGGGLILVPGLFFIFTYLGLGNDSKYLMHICIGTSLAVMVVSSISSVRAHYKRGSVSFELVRRIAPGIVAGVIIGSFIADIVSSTALRQFFAVVLVLLSIMMIADPSRFKLFAREPGQPWSSIIGMFNGTISTLAGIGGGALNVPYLILCQVPMPRAVGTSSALGLFIAVPAALGFVLIGLGEAGRPPFSLGFVNVLAWAIIIPFSFLSAPIGATVAHKLPVSTLRKFFAVFLIVVALKMTHDVFL